MISSIYQEPLALLAAVFCDTIKAIPPASLIALLKKIFAGFIEKEWEISLEPHDIWCFCEVSA